MYSTRGYKYRRGSVQFSLAYDTTTIMTKMVGSVPSSSIVGSCARHNACQATVAGDEENDYYNFYNDVNIIKGFLQTLPTKATLIISGLLSCFSTEGI